MSSYRHLIAVSIVDTGKLILRNKAKETKEERTERRKEEKKRKQKKEKTRKEIR